MSRKEGSNSRRDFIKKGMAGLAGVTVLPSVLKGQIQEPVKPQAETPRKENPMIYRTLGKTGLKLPIISLGVMNANNPQLVKAALDAGIIHLDTAWYYQMGRNEEMIGEVIKGRPRDSFVIATKVHEDRERETGLYPKEASADSFINKFETSLKRLGLDHVEILYHHNVSRTESLMFEPYLDALVKLKKAGKIRFIGVSTHKNEPEIIRAAADSKVYEVVLTAYNYRQLHRHEVEAAMAYAAKAGLGIVGMKAIAGTGEHRGKLAANARAALKWALQNENVHTNIPGMTTFDQLTEDLSVMADLKLTAEEKTALEADMKVASLYCQQCEKCLGQCRQGVAIPDLMRSYMYAYGYRNLCAAKETLQGMDLENLPCRTCGSCRVTCPMGFDIQGKILAISRIKDVPSDFLV